MILYVDDLAFGKLVFPEASGWTSLRSSGDSPAGLQDVLTSLYADKPVLQAVVAADWDWPVGFCVRHSAFSHFDLLIELCGRPAALPHGIWCLAGSGENFHGQRGRPWAAEAGNIHLSLHLRPDRSLDRLGIAFQLVAAISVLETVDDIPGLCGRSAVKWVNDILIAEEKIAGFVTHVQSQEGVVKSVVLGIGLNVERTPRVYADAFVPAVGSLRDFVTDPGTVRLARVFANLLSRLQRNYQRLLAVGVAPLLEAYRQRSLVIGRRVQIMTDSEGEKPQEIAVGRVAGIGENLELHLQERSRPIAHGRLILLS